MQNNKPLAGPKNLQKGRPFGVANIVLGEWGAGAASVDVEVGEKKILGLKLVQQTKEAIDEIRKRMKIT